MDQTWQIISGVGGVIGVVFVVLGLVWRWVDSAKKSAHERIERTEKRVDKISEDHDDFERKCIGMLEEIKQSLADKPTRQAVFEYADKTFVRKDVHSVEYTNLLTKISELDTKISKILNDKK